MRSLCISATLILLICTACSVKVTPVPTPTGTVNPEEQSLTEVRDGVAITVKLDELNVAPYQIIDNVTSFHVEIDNRTGKAVSFPTKAFMLKDGGGHQYRSITPEKVKEVVSKDTVYLIPYPYVGYYYLEDQAKMSHANTMSSDTPFYAEYHPQDIFTRALTEEPVLGGSKVSGVVYFIADLERTESAELLVFPDGSTAGEPLMKFPFLIEK